MIFALLLTFTPTIAIYLLLSRFKFQIKSKFLLLSVCWFLGQYLFTNITFLIAVGLSFFTSNLLFKASLALLYFVTLFVLCSYSRINLIVRNALKHKKIRHFFNPLNILIVLFCFLFSYFLFIPHLSSQNGAIYTSPIYWDFHWHAALIQNFTFGDNFPPQNEAFGGVPHTYHFFWGVLVGTYESLGMNLVDAINLISILSFFFVLLTLIGLSEEFFENKFIGIIAIVLTITSSSLHFIDYLKSVSNQNILSIVTNIFTTNAHPWTASFVTNVHSFNYNGTFFNLFYFIEERQLIIGALFLLLSCFIIYRRKELSNEILIITGGLMGSFFLWHLHITIMILCALFFLLFFDKDNRKKTILILTGFLIVFIAHFIYFKLITQSPWFTTTNGFPKLNFGFSDQENKPFSFLHAFNWYSYAYGLKLILLPIGLSLMKIKNKKIFLSLSSIIIPTFILLNTIQLSPGSIYESHKWLRTMNIVIDLSVAYIVYQIFFKRVSNLLKILGVLIMFFLTISGIIELMPFMNSTPTKFYAYYPSSIIQLIKSNTSQDSIFVGNDENIIHLAGRKMFLGDILGGGFGLDKERRQTIISDIYSSANLAIFCNLTLSNNVDYVELNESQKDHLPFIYNPDYFQTINDKNENVFFVDTKKTCDS